MKYLNFFRIIYNVIVALITRELKTKIVVNKLGYFGLILEYLLFCIPVVILRLYVYHGSFNNIFVFITTGLILVLFFNRVLNSCAHSIEANRALLVYRQINIPIIIFVRMLIELIVLMFMLLLMFFLYFVIQGEILMIENIILLFYSIFYLSLLAMIWGFCFAIIISIFEVFKYLLSYLSRFIFFFSGTFFYMSEMPTMVINYLMFNPVAQIIVCIRKNIGYGSKLIESDFFYLNIFLLISIFFAKILSIKYLDNILKRR